MGRDRQRDRVEDADYAPLLDCHPSPRPSGARTHLLSGRHGFGMKSTSSVLFFLDLEGSPEVQLISKIRLLSGGGSKRRCFLATSIVEREHAWNRQWIF
jgi:hypothetical protein